MTPEEYKQMKAFTRQDGFLMGLLWIVSFLCFVFIYALPSLSLLFDVMIISIPVTLYFMTKRYRDNVIGGKISFYRAMAYSFYVCFYAIILLAFGQWMYFEFLDGGQFFQGMQQMLNDANYREVFHQAGVEADVIKDTLKYFSEARPIEIALSFITQNIITSAMMALIVGVVCRKK